jgi:hypothetical protein
MEGKTMADEYILRSIAIAKLTALEVTDPFATITDAKRVLADMAAADVAKVVHGEWLRSDDDWNSLTTIQCSSCGEEWCFETDDDVSLLNYKHCPNCGAKMDGGEDCYGNDSGD